MIKVATITKQQLYFNASRQPETGSDIMNPCHAKPGFAGLIACFSNQLDMTINCGPNAIGETNAKPFYVLAI